MGSPGKGIGRFVWDQDQAKRTLHPQAWLLASLDFFSLESPGYGSDLPLLKVVLDRQLGLIDEADLFERGDWSRVLEGAMDLPSVEALAARKAPLLRQAAGISSPKAWLIA